MLSVPQTVYPVDANGHPLLVSPNFVIGQTKITTTGTPVNLPANPLMIGVVIENSGSNTIFIYNSPVSNITTGNGLSYELAPKASIGIAVDDTSRIYINGTAGDYVCFIGS